MNDREQIMKNAQVGIGEHHPESRGKSAPADLVSRRSSAAASSMRRRSLPRRRRRPKELSRNATVYCEGILKNSEEVLARSVADIKNIRMNLRSAARPNRGQQNNHCCYLRHNSAEKIFALQKAPHRVNGAVRARQKSAAAAH